MTSFKILTGIETEANNYDHPIIYVADVITDTAIKIMLGFSDAYFILLSEQGIPISVFAFGGIYDCY